MRVGYQKRTIAGDKTICLPVPDGVDYDTWIKDHVGFRQYLDSTNPYPSRAISACNHHWVSVDWICGV
jgi:hypothetical protein